MCVNGLVAVPRTRAQAGAQRLSMPPVPTEQFVSAVTQMVQSNRDFVSV